VVRPEPLAPRAAGSSKRPPPAGRIVLARDHLDTVPQRRQVHGGTGQPENTLQQDTSPYTPLQQSQRHKPRRRSRYERVLPGQLAVICTPQTRISNKQYTFSDLTEAPNQTTETKATPQNGDVTKHFRLYKKQAIQLDICIFRKQKRISLE
jgi:hypothetical protein